MKSIIILAISIILFASCYPEIDSIYNHKDEVIVKTDMSAGYSTVVTTRVKTESGYKFTEFTVYNSELENYNINDTIK